MPAAAVAAVGTASSLYSGMKSSKDAKKALEFAMKQYENNQKVAKELKARWNRLVEPNLTSMMAEAKSKDMTLAARLSAEELEKGIGKLRTEVERDADNAGTGMTEARLMKLDIDRARGIAGIKLDDEEAKRESLKGLMSFAAETPGWAKIQTGANTQMGNAYMGLYSDQSQRASSAYGAAAQGLYQLGQMYAGQQGTSAPASGGPSTQPYSGEYTTTQLRAQGLM